jgi:hypothetical protein
MRARICCLALTLGLLPVAASAQDGLRSASLPDRKIGASNRPIPDPPFRPIREDVFLARPETYRPDPNGTLMPVFGYFGPQFYPYIQPIIVVQVPRDAAEPARVVPPALPPPVAPPAPYVAGMPGRPKTFYVIPGCYAGDRRPEPESLAPGCRISRLRVVPPS